MSKRYDEVMEKIKVPDAMRRRILANIGQMDLDATPQTKPARFPGLKRLAPLAACLVLILAGTFALRHWMPGETLPPTPSTGVLTVNGIVDVADANALSDAVGFPVKELTALPFRVEETTYTSLWGEVAEITYQGEEQAAPFRQSVGAEDNSGDYNVYAETLVKEIGGLSVTLKGDGQVYPLAVWNDEEYAYSISTEPGLTIAEWETIIATR